MLGQVRWGMPSPATMFMITLGALGGGMIIPFGVLLDRIRLLYVSIDWDDFTGHE